ncbi:MAG: ATP synthase F0 subunit B [Alphaproteobacteria bacterium]|nr:ATP synthase F0 subunit B [Alphaproteobacteria bacterium]
MIHFNEHFWLAIAFFCFLGLSVKFVWPLLRKALDGSIRKIAEDILAAKEARQEAEAMLRKAEKICSEASAFADKILKDADAEIAKMVAEAQKDLEEEVVKRKASALSLIKIEEENAIRELKVKIINSSLGKLAKELKLTEQDRDKLADKALTNFGKTIH